MLHTHANTILTITKTQLVCDISKAFAQRDSDSFYMPNIQPTESSSYQLPLNIHVRRRCGLFFVRLHFNHLLQLLLLGHIAVLCR